jgi:hypothetical protein
MSPVRPSILSKLPQVQGYNFTFTAFIKENVMTAMEHDRQIQTSENRGNRLDARKSRCFYRIRFGSFSSGINRARCWSLN